MGNTCSVAIERFEREHDPKTCGGTSEHSNGNGSLMRILPACLYAYAKSLPADEAVRSVHEISGLTHNHLRSKIACGLYYFCACAILDEEGSLIERLQKGLDKGFAYYEGDIRNRVELAYYGRLRDLSELATAPESSIKSTGYVVDTIEAAVWSLVTTDSFGDCELKAVNLGDDSDTVGAIAGGLAGLYYGYDAIPSDWLSVIKRREWIEEMCREVF
jgi:ADP-ribosylglycohydrolase